VYSDFYEIPLPALRFEKVEETDHKVNDTEENNDFQKSNSTTSEEKQRRADSLARDDTQRTLKRFLNLVK
jgi:hypothetical protein